MKLENHEKSLIFSNTQIPDVFFTEYMSEANGDYIKVYMCMLFLTKFDKDIKLNDLSKRLNISLPVIQSALSYWEEKNVITKKTSGINRFNSTSSSLIFLVFFNIFWR